MADNKQKWQEATRQILTSLDLIAEYRALGLQLASDKPNSKGWIYCHSVDVDTDRSPSAGICVVDGPFLGRYKDFRSGRSVTFFDFAAERGRFGGQWKEVRNHFARQTGVKLPDGDEELVADRFEFFDLTFAPISFYAEGKPGVTARAIQEVGTRGARWPKGLAAEKTNHLFAVPMYGSALLDLEPTGWHCCTANPNRKIRKYQGKDNEEALLPKMTVGEYGLMNVEALRNLPDATVVNVVEGLTDLYAGQAVIGPWCDVDPENRRHVVLSAGGSSCHPKAEWIQHFAGKEIRLWFDVGDANDAGQIGAAVWAAALIPVAKLVRNVKLPLGKDGGKNDLRAWLHGGGRTYAEMDAYAQTFEPIEPSDLAAQLTPQDAILANLGLVVIGEHEGSQKVEVFSEQTKKSGTIQDIDKLSIPKLVQFLGYEVVDRFVHEGKEPQPGKYQIRDVKNAIAAAASDKIFHGEERYGAGIWESGGQIVLVRSREVGLLNASTTKVERSHIPFHNGCVLDISQSSEDWIEFGTLNRYLAEAIRPEWCWATFEEACDLFGKWYWRHKPAPKIVASLIMASWLQTTWEWRPQVFLTGSSDTGKSLLLEDVINRGIFGKLALYTLKPTEAAVRQHLVHHAKIPMFDEFEEDKNRQKIFELFRASSRGGDVIRGTSNQHGVRYRVRHLPWFAAIETGLRKQADVNRFIVLELETIPEDQRGKIVLPGTDALRDLGVRLLAVALRNYREARRIAGVLKGNQFAGVPGRLVECYAVPWAIVAALYQMSDEAAAESLEQVFAAWDFVESSARDDVNVLQEILTSEVYTEGGRRYTVSQLLDQTQSPDTVDALCRVGIRKVTKRAGIRAGEECLFVCPSVVRKNLLKANGDFTGQSIGQYLARLSGAKKSSQRLGGTQPFNGIEIPQTTISKIFAASDDATEQQDSEYAEAEETETSLMF